MLESLNLKFEVMKNDLSEQKVMIKKNTFRDEPSPLLQPPQSSRSSKYVERIASFKVNSSMSN